ncbi:MAG: hypothetical protein JST80_08185 [Bdellovibrionales bacterium]|nr:hypothetical protein [Bdellovibrionales bacterium]
MISRLISGLLILTVSAVAAPPMDSDRDHEAILDPAHRQAVIQIKPAFDSFGRSCTSIQLEPKIILTAGHCTGILKGIVDIPQWSSLGYKVAAKRRQPPLANEGMPNEQVDPNHELGLVLVQPRNCRELNANENHTFPLNMGAIPKPKDKKFEIASYGGSGFKFAGYHPDNVRPMFSAETYTDKQQTTSGEVFQCFMNGGKKDSKKQSFQNLIDSFKRTSKTIQTVATREVQISENSGKIEVLRRDGTVFQQGDSGSALVQRDADGKPVITGILSGTGNGPVLNAKLVINTPNAMPIEILIPSPKPEWADPAIPTSTFDIVKENLRKLHLKPGSYTLSRKYEVQEANFFSSLSDPQNAKFLKDTLAELRALRDTKVGCKTQP